jgi:hypothetical protein
MRVLVRVALLSATLLLPVEASAQDSPGAGKPANLCQEIVAFVHQPDPALKSDAPPPQLATAVSAKKPGDTSEKPAAGGTPQNTSGQSGQITASGPGAAGPQGDAQNKAAPAGSTATAAAPPKDVPPAAPAAAPAAPPAPKPTAENVQQVEAAAAKNDLQECRAVGQQMRRAGVAMPAPLLALSAMDPKLLEAAQRP